MKRRTFGLMAGTSMAALMGPMRRSFADTPDASLLQTTLTPFGSERAGNAAGTIPAWTGGLTAIPPGFESWDPNKTLPPDFFASDAMLYEVNASNMAQYSDLISEGIQALIQKQGFSLKVYPTHRTQALPQWVMDNIVLNLTRTTPQSGEYRLGFNGAYGGVPFPIPSSDPSEAGAQIIWNNEARWNASYLHQCVCSYTVSNGLPIQVNGERDIFRNEYYLPGGSPETYSGYFYTVAGPGQFAPATVAGGQIISKNSSNPVKHPNITWQLLAGQGRVRKAPEVLYDTPSSYADGIINYDEYFGFNGPLDKYDWKLLGKKEMLIPYNNNKVFTGIGPALHKPKFFDPEYVRWELHRVWEVEATLHPGERNVLARRRFYVDEDDWTVHVTDAWDANGNIARTQTLFNANFPNLPGTIFMNSIGYNLQTGNYVSLQGSYADAPYNTPWTFQPVPDSVFLPQAMAAAASY